MSWNWEKKNWPGFFYRAGELENLETAFQRQAGVLAGSMKHVAKPDQAAIQVDLASTEALKTSEIEGEMLDRASVQSSMRRQFGLAADARKARPAEQGIAEMMASLSATFEKPLSIAGLLALHRMLFKGRPGGGAFRTHGDPMQIVSGPAHLPRVHFEAPPSSSLPREMAEFIAWFQASVPAGRSALPPLARAGLAHLYFVSIHPFEDGNGRIARALAQKALSQALGIPLLLALSQTIQANKKAYYDNLEANNQELEVTDWLKYFGATVMQALERSQQLLDFVIEKGNFYRRLAGQMNARQAKAMDRMFQEGPSGFEGGLSAGKYIQITKAPHATATRDLHDLVAMGALTKKGELKHTRYYLKLDETRAE